MYQFPLKIIPLAALLLAIPLTATGEEEKPAKPTDDQIRAYLEKREEYKDKPEMQKLLSTIEERVGITEDVIERVQSGQPAFPDESAAQQPRMQGDPDVAESAYQKGDYETAKQHYEALAVEGDGRANFMLGLMYHEGAGVDKDMSKAHAYFDRAADYGEERGLELVDTLDRELEDEALEQAEQQYLTIVDEQTEAGAPEATERNEKPRYATPVIEAQRPGG
ncbi:MAG: hypothetical protein WD572_12400 [Gammaproteobacteria bacterium]